MQVHLIAFLHFFENWIIGPATVAAGSKANARPDAAIVTSVKSTTWTCLDIKTTVFLQLLQNAQRK